MTTAVVAKVILPSERAVEAILRECVARFGGVYGVRDLATIHAALLKGQHATAEAEQASAIGAAAAIGTTLSRSLLPSVADRNLGAAWLTMFVTLRLNGRYLDARESDATAIVLGVADGSVSEDQLVAFLEANSTEVPA